MTIEVTPSGLPLARWLPAVLLVQLALLLVCAWLAVRLAMRPLQQLSHAVEHLQPGKDEWHCLKMALRKWAARRPRSTHCRHAFVAMSVSACRSWPRSRMTCRPPSRA